MTPNGNWEGHRNPTHHRSTGVRAWCLSCGEWCYEPIACACCQVAMADENPCTRCKGTGIEPERHETS